MEDVAYQCCHELKRDKIIQLIQLNDEEPLLVVLSNRGRVLVYDRLWKPRTSFVLNPVDGAAQTSKKRLAGWITDAAHMKECSTIVVASRERTLHFFTTVVVPFSERIRLYGMKDIPTSLAYYASERLEPTLSIGDDGGDSFILTFLKASQALFKKREVQGLQKVFWKELYLQAGMVDLTVLPGSHKRPVLETQITGPFHKIISCSKSPKWSLAVRQLHNKVPPVVIDLFQGVTCFAYQEDTETIFTGSRDGKIRIWTAVDKSKPWATYKGHANPIVALLLRGSKHLWSLCEKPEIQCWDIATFSSLKTINIHFPLSPGTKLEFAKRPLHISGSSLIIACCDYFAKIDISIANSAENLESESTRIDSGSGSATPRTADPQSKIPLNFREDLLEKSDQEENAVFIKFKQDLQAILPNSSNRDLRFDSGSSRQVYDWQIEFENLKPPEGLISLNRFKLRELERLPEVRKCVKDMSPFCALNLPEPEVINLQAELPVSLRMRRNGMEFFTDLNQIRSVNWDILDDGLLSGLNSARSSLASSLTSYYKHKHLTEKKAEAAIKSSAMLEVTSVSQQSSRKSSIVSQASDNSSGRSGSSGR